MNRQLMNRMKVLFLVLITLMALLLAVVSGVSAQGAINYGQNVTGSLEATSPIALYTFSGTTGDLVTARVIAISPDLDPALSLLSPTQQQVASNNNDPLVPGGTDARISTVLPNTGIYILLISSADASTGDFLLLLDGQAGGAGELVEEDPFADSSPVDNGTGGGAAAPAQTFAFNADPNAPTNASFDTSDAGYQFGAEIRNATEQLVAFVTGSDVEPVSLTLAAGTQNYTVDIFPSDPNVVGTVNFVTSLVAPPQETPPQPVETEEVTEPCLVTPANNNVNIRATTNTNSNVVGQLIVGQNEIATGLSLGDDTFIWYQVLGGWVRADVVDAIGPCATLPTVGTGTDAQAPAATDEVEPTPDEGQPPAPASATPTPSYTPLPGQQPPPTATPPQQQQPPPTATPPQQQQPPTATVTPSRTSTLQPSVTPTPSYTPTSPPPAQVAPEDARFNNPLNIPLDNTASVLDFVSYPGGDREDRVRWDITGMNPNSSLPGGQARLVISVSCFGQNTNQVQFFTGGQTYSCGQTIVDQQVTFNSKTGSVVITAVGGTNTYVQWVLTGTATRTN